MLLKLIKLKWTRFIKPIQIRFNTVTNRFKNWLSFIQLFNKIWKHEVSVLFITSKSFWKWLLRRKFTSLLLIDFYCWETFWYEGCSAFITVRLPFDCESCFFPLMFAAINETLSFNMLKVMIWRWKQSIFHWFPQCFQINLNYKWRSITLGFFQKICSFRILLISEIFTLLAVWISMIFRFWNRF